MRLADRHSNHGLQTRSPETLAPPQRISPAPQSGHRRQIYRRRGGTTTSRLTVINQGCAFFLYTTFDNISRATRTWRYRRRQQAQLTEGEAVFRTLKSELNLRPIFHRIQRRVEEHILIAFLGLLLVDLSEAKATRSGRFVCRDHPTRSPTAAHSAPLGLVTPGSTTTQNLQGAKPVCVDDLRLVGNLRYLNINNLQKLLETAKLGIGLIS
jgi:hypothetical protein